MKVYDCFMYFDEDTILDLRLNYLNPYVDKFVIVESKFTHSGKKKELSFDIEKFKTLIQDNSFYEHAKIFNNHYGTLKEPVLKNLSEGKDVLFDIDWQGTQQLKKIKNLNLVTFFILPPNIETLKKRLLNRHQGQEKLILQRMNKFNEEISHWNEYNYIVTNDDLDICYNKILNIIMAEKKGIRQKQNFSEIELKIKELVV